MEGWRGDERVKDRETWTDMQKREREWERKRESKKGGPQSGGMADNLMRN